MVVPTKIRIFFIEAKHFNARWINNTWVGAMQWNTHQLIDDQRSNG